MSEPIVREYRRGDSSAIWVLFAVMAALMGLVFLLNWLKTHGLLFLLMVVASFAVCIMAAIAVRWHNRTPYVQLTQDYIQILERPFVKPKRLRLADIARVDRSKTDRINLVSPDGRPVEVYQAGFQFDDWPDFLRTLEACIGSRDLESS